MARLIIILISTAFKTWSSSVESALLKNRGRSGLFSFQDHGKGIPERTVRAEAVPSIWLDLTSPDKKLEVVWFGVGSC